MHEETRVLAQDPQCRFVNSFPFPHLIFTVQNHRELMDWAESCRTARIDDILPFGKDMRGPKLVHDANRQRYGFDFWQPIVPHTLPCRVVHFARKHQVDADMICRSPTLQRVLAVFNRDLTIVHLACGFSASWAFNDVSDEF